MPGQRSLQIHSALFLQPTASPQDFLGIELSSIALEACVVLCREEEATRTHICSFWLPFPPSRFLFWFGLVVVVLFYFYPSKTWPSGSPSLSEKCLEWNSGLDAFAKNVLLVRSCISQGSAEAQNWMWSDCCNNNCLPPENARIQYVQSSRLAVSAGLQCTPES